MKHLYVPGQDRLKYTYESAQARLGYDPEREEQYRKLLQELPVYTNEEDAVKAFWDIREHGSGSPYSGYSFVWAKIGVDEEYYYLQEDYFLVTDDNLIHQAAEFMGLIETVPNQ